MIGVLALFFVDETTCRLIVVELQKKNFFATVNENLRVGPLDSPGVQYLSDMSVGVEPLVVGRGGEQEVIVLDTIATSANRVGSAKPPQVLDCGLFDYLTLVFTGSASTQRVD